jgi:hypothetical protein
MAPRHGAPSKNGKKGHGGLGSRVISVVLFVAICAVNLMRAPLESSLDTSIFVIPAKAGTEPPRVGAAK